MLGEKLLLKMWETLIENGIGSLATPWQIKRQGKAHLDVRREEILALAQAEKDAAQIKCGKMRFLPDGKLIPLTDPEINIDISEPKVDIASLDNKILVQKKATEILQEINLNKAILLAEDELLRSTKEVSEETIDSDWIFRWQENAKKVQNKELREIWARVLAGEVKSPGSHSLRTLEFIKNLSKEEALSISKLGQFLINNSIIMCTRLQKVGIDLPFLLQMDDLGIISGIESGVLSGFELVISSDDIEKHRSQIINRNIILSINTKDPSKKAKLRCYRVPRIGKELLLLGDFEADKEYMKEIKEMIEKQGFNVKLSYLSQLHPEHGQLG